MKVFEIQMYKKILYNVIGGISTRSNLISSKIESRNKAKVLNAYKQHRVKLLEIGEYLSCATKDGKCKNVTCMV